MRAVMTLQRHFPHVKVCVRARDDEYATKLRQAGAIAIVPNLLEPILQMASTVLKLAGTPKDEVHQVIDVFRSDYQRENEKKLTDDQ
jgi:CPA2 family monovalent cation:H+ antiporter-2